MQEIITFLSIYWNHVTLEPRIWFLEMNYFIVLALLFSTIPRSFYLIIIYWQIVFILLFSALNHGDTINFVISSSIHFCRISFFAQKTSFKNLVRIHYIFVSSLSSGVVWSGSVPKLLKPLMSSDTRILCTE